MIETLITAAALFAIWRYAAGIVRRLRASRRADVVHLGEVTLPLEVHRITDPDTGRSWYVVPCQLGPDDQATFELLTRRRHNPYVEDPVAVRRDLARLAERVGHAAP